MFTVILLSDCYKIFSKSAKGSKIFLWRYGFQACFVYQKCKITFYQFLEVISWNQFFIPACSRIIANYFDLKRSVLVLAFLAKNWGFSIILKSYSSRLNFINFFFIHHIRSLLDLIDSLRDWKLKGIPLIPVIAFISV